MKRVCPLCDQVVVSENMFCEKSDCPAEKALTIWETGDWIGEFEIVRRIVILPASTLYECRRQDEPVLLKVAHQGNEHKERLKREATFLYQVHTHRRLPDSMPVWLPPSSIAGSAERPYGKIVHDGQLLYFVVFEHSAGDSLRAVSKKHPQLWTKLVGWTLLEIAEAISFLHASDHFHLGLCPESILIRFDQKPPGAPRALLIDLGLLARNEDIAHTWYPGFLHPAYAAPEQIDPTGPTLRADGNALRLDPGTDIYGMGVVLYEMLAGEPPIPYKLRPRRSIYRDVLSGNFVDLTRQDDTAKLAGLARNATAAKLSERIRQIKDFGGALVKYVGPVPPPPKEGPVSKRTLLIVGISLLSIAVILVTALAMSG